MDKVMKTEAEWRAELDELTYRVTREHATERPFSHDDFPDDPGTYRCTCCGAPLFDAETKFDAGCGWPSFNAPLARKRGGRKPGHAACSCAGPRSTAPAATRIWAMSSPTGRHRPACATASTAWR